MVKGTIYQQIEGFVDVMHDKALAEKHGIDMEQQALLCEDLVTRIHPKKLQLTVSEIIHETDTVITIRLVSENRPLPPFEAGQYLNLSVCINGVQTSRAYSISSAPFQTSYFDITVKRVKDGFVSNYLFENISVGDELESSGPAGEFHYNPLFHGNDLVMLAGGSGITPMMSMIREFLNCGKEKNIHLIYVCRTPEEAIFRRELGCFVAEFDNFKFHTIISRPKKDYEGLTGHINRSLLGSLLKNITNKTYYLCGPSGMCDLASNDLEALGVRRGKIRQETFGETTDVTKMNTWPSKARKGFSINIDVSGVKSFKAPVGEPLLNSLDRAGLSILSSCHSGECSLCRVKLVSGNVFQLHSSKVRKSDRKSGYIHSCCSYPTEDVKIEI